MLPRWKLLSLIATTPDLRVFVRKLASTGLSPFDFIALPCDELVAKTRIDIVNVVAAKAGAEAVRMQYVATGGVNRLVNPGLYPRNLVDTGDLSLRCVNIARPGDDDNCTAGPKSGVGRHADELLAHAGPEMLLDSEMKFHEVIILPATVVFTAMYNGVYSRVLQSTADLYANKGTYTAYMYLSNLNTYLYMFTIVHGITQIIVCAFAKLDDRLSSHYLTVPLFFRFADFFSILVAFVVLGPWELFMAKLGEAPSHVNGIAFWVVDGILALTLQLAVVASIVYFYLRMSTASFPMMMAGEVSDVPGSGHPSRSVEENIVAAAAADGEAAAAAAVGVVRRDNCGGGDGRPLWWWTRAWRWCVSLVARTSAIDSNDRLECLSAIGRFRRKEFASDIRDELTREMAVRTFFSRGEELERARGGGGGSGY